MKVVVRQWPCGTAATRRSAERATAVAPGHVGGGAGLIEEDEARRIHEAPPGAQRRRLPATSGRSCSAALRRSFLCRRPSRRSASWIVQSPARTPQRRCSSAWSSASSAGRRRDQMRGPARGATSSGRRGRHTARGRREVARTRCISSIAADGPTAKRWAAARIEPPRSTARAILRRRSMEIGAGMATSPPGSTVIVESQELIPRNRNML